MDSQIVHLLVILFSLFHLFSSSVNSNSITLSLSRQPKHYSSKSEELSRLAIASSARAQFLKQSGNDPTSTVEDPLFARSYGEYSLDLSFGTPSQTLSLILDTGSSLVWFPCTRNFTCNGPCETDGVEPMPAFIPESSSSSRYVACNTQQCKWFHTNHTSSPNCTSGPCPGYKYEYGSGNTTGSLMSEILTFPNARLDNFLVGCSNYAYGIPSGVVGFGSSVYSLPSQMGLDSFAYCMVSYDFADNSTVSSDLVLTKGGGKGAAPAGIKYTPFVKNQRFQEYYYVSLLKIRVGLVDVIVPDEYHSPNSKGNGGTIVDSGTTATVMDKSVLDSVIKEFEKQFGKMYIRNTTSENETGLEFCYEDVSGDELPFKHIPKLSFHFEGDAVMDLPLENYFVDAGNSVGCMVMAPMGIFPDNGTSLGPAIVLGNYLQQNFYMEYDLKHNRLGIHKQECNS